MQLRSGTHIHPPAFHLKNYEQYVVQVLSKQLRDLHGLVIIDSPYIIEDEGPLLILEMFVLIHKHFELLSSDPDLLHTIVLTCSRLKNMFAKHIFEGTKLQLVNDLVYQMNTIVNLVIMKHKTG